MTELKTLKDLPKEERNVVKELMEYDRMAEYIIEVVNVTELKHEIIKWIKDRNKVIDNPNISREIKLIAMGAIRDFTDFFNITEEDLK